jgi:predicted O-methyltransferase YrrM
MDGGKVPCPFPMGERVKGFDEDRHRPIFAGLMKRMRFDTPRMVQGLVDLCEHIPPHSIGVEVGSFAGESSLIFMESGKVELLHCVDPWSGNYYRDKQTLRAEHVFDLLAERYKPHIRKHKRTSFAALSDFRNQDRLFDFVYIDGNHRYPNVKEDIELSLPIIKAGGILCGHDFNMTGVRKAVEEKVGKPDRCFADYSWLKRV